MWPTGTSAPVPGAGRYGAPRGCRCDPARHRLAGRPRRGRCGCGHPDDLRPGRDDTPPLPDVQLALVPLATSAAFVLDEPAAAVDAVPRGRLQRADARGVVLLVPLTVWVSAVLAVDLRTVGTPAVGLVVEGLGVLVAATAGAAVLRLLGSTEPGEVVATARSRSRARRPRLRATRPGRPRVPGRRSVGRQLDRVARPRPRRAGPGGGRVPRALPAPAGCRAHRPAYGAIAKLAVRTQPAPVESVRVTLQW